MAVRIDLTLDCARPGRLAEFWKLALGYVDEPVPAPFTSRAEWIRHFDPDDPDTDGAWLCDPAGIGPRLCLLPVPEPKVAKNRLHLDVRVAGAGEAHWPSVLATVARLAEAGASVLHEFAGHHMVLADPEGNEFCVC